MTITNFLTKLKFRLPACIVWFHYAPSSIIWWFLDNFFLLSVQVALKKKKKALLGLIKHVGVFLALCGVCACALMQVLLLPIGRGFTGQCLDIGAWDLASAIGGRVPEAVVTFEPREEALGAWQEVNVSVNEALYAGAMEGTVRLDGSRRWFEADVVAMTCCYSAHTGNEVSSCVGGVAERPPSVCVCFGLEEAVCFNWD